MGNVLGKSLMWASLRKPRASRTPEVPQILHEVSRKPRASRTPEVPQILHGVGRKPTSKPSPEWRVPSRGAPREERKCRRGQQPVMMVEAKGKPPGPSRREGREGNSLCVVASKAALDVPWSVKLWSCMVFSFSRVSCVCAVASVVSWLRATLWSVAHQAPLSADSAGKNSAMGCHVLLQGIFPTPGQNPHLLCLLRRRQALHHRCHLGSSLHLLATGMHTKLLGSSLGNGLPI